MNDWWVHGNFAWMKDSQSLCQDEDAWYCISEGRIKAKAKQLPPHIPPEQICDYGTKLIIPAFVDVHLHAVQYVNRGLGMDKQLLDWLRSYTYPEEKRFESLEYALPVFKALVRELWEVGSLRSCIYSSLHEEATLLLMRLLQQAGLAAYVGKVNMDRHSEAGLHETCAQSIAATESWLERCQNLATKVKPIITPRFAPSCSPELLQALGKLVAEQQLPVQSHLNENTNEIAWVKELFPHCANYLEVYSYYGLLPPGRSIMAHAIYNTPAEQQNLLAQQVLLAHCPSSNLNIASGIMPCRQMLAAGHRIALASDISGGEDLALNTVMKAALQSSAMLSVQHADRAMLLNWQEVFYLATKAGANFFAAEGDFELNSLFDALVIADEDLQRFRPLSLAERLQKFIYLGRSSAIVERFLEGCKLPPPLL